MSGFSTNQTDHLIRSELWSNRLKEVFLEDLIGMKYVEMITDFPDGNLINIPSIGQAEALDYAEEQPIRYTAMDTGNFTFEINEYKHSATYVTNKMKQDSMYMARVISSFVPKQHRALMKAVELDVLAVGPLNQTTGDNLNTINGGNHRFIASGPSETIVLEDFARAQYALDMANVPVQGRVAIVDPSVAFTLQTQANLVNLLSPNPQWQNIMNKGMVTGSRFVFSIFGFDVYVSQNLMTLNTTIDGLTTTSGKANLFFGTAGDACPFIGLVRQPPTVESEYNKDLQRDEHLTIMRYGFDLYRPESLVVVVSDTDQVYA